MVQIGFYLGLFLWFSPMLSVDALKRVGDHNYIATVPLSTWNVLQHLGIERKTRHVKRGGRGIIRNIPTFLISSASGNMCMFDRNVTPNVTEITSVHHTPTIVTHGHSPQSQGVKSLRRSILVPI